MNKEKCLSKLKKFKTKNGITLNCYEGYSYIHIDISENDEIVAWLTINEDNCMKICKTKQNFGYDKNDKYILKTIVKIAKFLSLNKIYGRVLIENEYCEAIFNKYDFSFEEQYDKDYRSAKVKLLFF